MDFLINTLYSDYSSNFPQNTEDLNYVVLPNTNKVNINAFELTEISTYATYYPSLEYFYKFRLKENITFYNSTDFDKLIIFRRTAGLTLPIAEIQYHYEYTKSVLLTSYVKNVSAFLSQGTLAVQILTKSNVFVPKNDEAVMVYGTRNLELIYHHIAHINFNSKLNNFYISANRGFLDKQIPCKDELQENILKNYDVISAQNAIK